MTQHSMILSDNRPYMTRGILPYFLEIKEICYWKIVMLTGLIWLILSGLLKLYINCPIH